ncbi:MAG: hypothetical protein ABI542_11835 [Gemmatimonadota bacterium]
MLTGVVSPLAAQTPTAAPPRLRLFLDCHVQCERDFLRTEITMVDWVTDRTASDVHVIASGLRTGAGGSEVTLEFIGRGRLAARVDTVAFTTPPNASDDDVRQEFARVLRLGLVRYLLATGQAGSLTLESGDMSGPGTASTANDPWNKWVFTVGADVEFDAESQERRTNIGGDLNANHTSADWKVRLGVGGNVDRTTFTLEDGSKFHARRDRSYGSGLVVRSINDHWSVGATGGVRSSKPDNLDLRVRLAPAIEWDLFPYAEVTRRQLIVVYSAGVTRYDYVEPTIFDKTQETRLDHELQVAYASSQPWGNARLSGAASSFLDDWASNRLSIYGSLEVRLTRGLSFDAEASYSRIRDQITLRKGDASDEEIFLRLRELATGYRANIQVGLKYRFGSFFNSVVNPRFDIFDN